MSAHHCSLFDNTVSAPDSNTGEIELRPLTELPGIWEAALEALQAEGAAFTRQGERVLVLATGPLVPVARAFAFVREEGQWGLTDAMPADEPRLWRDWDRVLAISPFGHEPELLHAMRHLPPRVQRTAMTTDPASALAALADDLVSLPARTAESSVAFETTFLLVARSVMGVEVADLGRQASVVLASDVPSVVPGTDHIVFVGSGWAGQVALRCAQTLGTIRGIRSESHAVRDARYGAIDHADSRSVIWFLGKAPEDVRERAAATGAVVTTSTRDPILDYVDVHRMAGELRVGRTAQ